MPRTNELVCLFAALVTLLNVSSLAVAQDDDAALAEPVEEVAPPEHPDRINLNDDGSSWMTVGGHARIRVESWSNFAFGGPAEDNDTFVLFRALLHADAHISDDVRVFVQGKSALSTERELPGGRRHARRR